MKIAFYPRGAAPLALGLILMFGGGVRAEADAQAAIPSAGAMHDIPRAQEKPDPALRYKIVFDVQTLADSSDAVSPALKSIGALLNTYRNYGVPADHIQATAVFHGQTIVLVTRDEVYHDRTGAEKNPNQKLLGELAAFGVQLVVCGQSAQAQHYAAADLIPAAHLNLSATVTFINLQTKGYVKVSE